jgi:hypothetical protein
LDEHKYRGSKAGTPSLLPDQIVKRLETGRSYVAATVGGRGSQKPQPIPEQLEAAADPNGQAFAQCVLAPIILALMEKGVAHTLSDLADWFRDLPVLTHELHGAVGFLLRTNQIHARPWVEWPECKEKDLIVDAWLEEGPGPGD